MGKTSLGSLRKGITPVVATVLLLGITVAIGLTVYTQAQGLIGDLGDGGLQKVQETDLQLTPVYSNGGQLEVKVTNTGERAINTSEFTMYFAPPNFPDAVSYNQVPDSWNHSDGSNQCLSASDSSTVLGEGESINCLTGVKFPGALEKVEVVVRANNFDYSASKLCEVSSAGAKSC